MAQVQLKVKPTIKRQSKNQVGNTNMIIAILMELENIFWLTLVLRIHLHSSRTGKFRIPNNLPIVPAIG